MKVWGEQLLGAFKRKPGVLMFIEDRDRQLYDAIAGKYLMKDIVESSSIARQYKVFCAFERVLAEKNRIGTLVEVGCGAGATAVYLRSHYDHYIGIDQSGALIEGARSLNRDNNAEFFSKNIKSEELPAGIADVIFASGALHHMTELDDVMVSLKKIARPKSWLVVVEPQNFNPVIWLLRLLRGKFDKSYSKEQIFFSPYFLRDLFAKHGLEDIRVDFQGFFSTPFAEVIINPQSISVPLSRLAIKIDGGIKKYFPQPLQKNSFNVVVTARFPQS